MAGIRQVQIPKAPSRTPKAGTEVVFAGLIGRKYLNGVTGTVVPHIDGTLEDSTHRCRVQVHGTDYTVKVLARNISPVVLERKWEKAMSMEATATPSEDHLVLPTDFRLNIDKGCALPTESPRPKFYNRTCTAKGNQLLGETYAKIQKSAAGRDPGRLRHKGLSFFRDRVDEEAHPGNSSVRTTRTKDTFMHTMRHGYDWRKDGYPVYVDPLHIPEPQGGHASHVCLEKAADKDDIEGQMPTNPRLRGILLNEDLDPEVVYEPVERAYRELLLFTGERDNLRLKTDSGPARNVKQREAEFAKREARKEKLCRERLALSVKPGDSCTLPPPAKWTGRPIDMKGSVDPMAYDMKNMMSDADAGDGFTLENLMNRPKSGGKPWEANVHDHPRFLHKVVDREQTPSWVAEESSDKSKWGIPAFVSHRLPPGFEVEGQLAQPPDITESQLLIPNPWTEEVLNEMLRKSTEDAEKGFDYGPRVLTPRQRPVIGFSGAADAPDGSTEHLPWYEGELASSSLPMDANFEA